ncbi:MAG: MerR family transcriptional regulator [Nitrospinae bacterium]|nr:MerR family transcriptional regulator [Nitrospinota bacterium]
MTAMTISKVAKKAGVGIETVRFYERKGLVDQPPKPPSGGYRVYPAETGERIRFIRQAQELGFTLREIKELLSLRTDPATDCADVRERAQTKLDEVNRRITLMKGIQTALEKLIAACPGQGALQVCSIIDAIEAPETTGTELKKRRRKNHE